MNSYKLSILDSQGGSTELELSAEDRESLTRRIEEEGWVVLRVRAKRMRPISLKGEELILLCQHLQLMLSAGLPMRDAFSALAEERDSRLLSQLCSVSAERIDQGQSLSQALEHMQLDRFFLAMIKTGEMTGRLPELLGRAAQHLQWRDELKRKVMSSLHYPLLVIAVLLLVVPLLFIYLVPQLLGFLEGQNAVFPWYTRALIRVAEFTQSYGLWLLFVLFFSVTVVAFVWRVIPAFRLFFDRVLLKAPLLGALLLQLKTAQLSEQLGIMYGAGIPIAEALPLVAESLGNRVLSEHLHRASLSIGGGESLHSSLSAHVFPAMLLRLVKVGELSGSLEKTLAQAAILYSRQAHRRADKLAAVVGPVALLLAGVVIVWLVAALILPLYDGLFSMGTGL